MEKLPNPPPVHELATVRPALKVMKKRTLLWRVYFRGGPYPTIWNAMRRFGPVATARFDHHEEPAQFQRRAVLYAARQGPTCFAEVFQDTRVIDRHRRHPWLVAFELSRPVRLLDLTGTWPTRAGASMAIASGIRSRARRWARAIYAAYPSLEGLYYPSSMHANAPSVVFNERAAPALPPRPRFHRSLLDSVLLRIIRHTASDIGYGVV